MKITDKIILCLLFPALLFSCAGCGTTDDGAGNTVVDYRTADLSPYVSFDGQNYREMQISVEKAAPVTDEDIANEFNSYFSKEDSPYYLPVADTGRAVKNGDYLYLLYSGVRRSDLEAAVAKGKIGDVLCTGMTYSEIVALSLGFQGGTINRMYAMPVGSAGFIDGFESGLVGLVPSEHGEENPVRLELSFPERYQNADLAGAPVVFFCRLFYIGDPGAGTYRADNTDIATVNTILGLTGEDAYESMEQCLGRIRDGLQQKRASALYSAKSDAIMTKLSEMATVSSVPDEFLTHYVNTCIDEYFGQLNDLYNRYPAYYQARFGDAAPSRETVIRYLGYRTDTYMTEMKKDAVDAVKKEMIFYYIVQREGISLSEEEIAAAKEKYIGLYGSSVFDGIEESEIYDQFLRDKFIDGMIEELDAAGHVTYIDPRA